MFEVKVKTLDGTNRSFSVDDEVGVVNRFDWKANWAEITSQPPTTSQPLPLDLSQTSLIISLIEMYISFISSIAYFRTYLASIPTHCVWLESLCYHFIGSSRHTFLLLSKLKLCVRRKPQIQVIFYLSETKRMLLYLKLRWVS